MITGGLVNVVRTKHLNQFTKRRWQRSVATPYGRVGFSVVHQENTWAFEPGAMEPTGTYDPHEDLWLYVRHGAREYIGCFRTEQFTPEQIASTAVDFACNTQTH